MNDLEHLENYTNKEIYAQVLLYVYDFIPVKSGLTNEEYDIEIIKKLKFSNIRDNERLRSCIDLIEDTECAIVEYYTDGLCVKQNSLGEKYLRLYGILNAVSLQIEAIIELIELFKVPNKKTLKKDLKALKISQIRNKIGSHTVKYIDNTTGKEVIDSYRVTQTSLSKSGRKIAISSIFFEGEEINLPQILNEYNNLSSEILKEICIKAIFSLFKNDSEDRRTIIKHFSFATERVFTYQDLKRLV